ncbi:MAG: amidohydrolase family protein [Candidatus Asgardarchaeia archaeon]
MGSEEITLIKNGIIITMNGRRRIIKDGAVAIKNDTIVAVGPTKDIEKEYKGDKIIDGRKKIVMPGFIDTHVHNAQTLLRGVITDYEISIPPVWIRYLIPYEANLTKEDMELVSTLTQLNMIEHGITTFLEAGGPHPDAIGEAMKKTGIRGVITKSTVDMGNMPESMTLTTEEEIKANTELVEKWNGKENDRIRAWFSLREIVLSSEELFHKFKELAEKYKVGITAHIAEAHMEVEYSLEHYKLRPVEWLYHIGFLGKNVVLSHAAFLTPKEVHLLGETKTNVAYCPSIDHMLMSAPRVPEMLAAGVNVSIGSDGGWKTSIDILGEIRLASIVQKQCYGFPYHDRTAVDAKDLLEMATINGAKALMWDDQIGSIEPGKKADIVIIDTNRPHFTPINDIITTLVYCGTVGDVDTVIIDGKILYESKKFIIPNVDELLEKAQSRTEEIMELIKSQKNK